MKKVFTKEWLSDISGKEITLPFEDLAMECYRNRLAEFKDENRKIE